MSKTQEQIAREWAIRTQSRRALSTDEETQAAADLIMEVTRSVTMADVGWNSNQNCGQHAQKEDGTEVIMLEKVGDDIQCLDPSNLKFRIIPDEDLIPTSKYTNVGNYLAGNDFGRREYLTTQEDFDNAPAGTICASRGYAPMVKIRDKWHSRGGLVEDPANSRFQQRILRKGWD